MIKVGSSIADTYALVVRNGDVLTVPVNSLTFQGVTFKTKLVGNVFDVEIDAAVHTGDRATAKYIDAIELSGIGTFSSFTMGSSGVSWTPKKANLSASGCKSGRGATDACAQGTPLSLGDNMHFTFTFEGATLDDTAPVIDGAVPQREDEEAGLDAWTANTAGALMLAGLGGVGIWCASPQGHRNLIEL